MRKGNRNQPKKKEQIQAILPTDDQLTGSAGISLFALYLRNINLLPIIQRLFGTMRKNSKGLPIAELFLQMLCFFMAGTSRHLTRFNTLQADKSYATMLSADRLASSHAMKHFPLFASTCSGACCRICLSGD